MATSNVDKVRDYFHRQYELEEGSVEENIYALFTEDADLMADGEAVTLEDIARAAVMLRRVPKTERIMESSGFKEEGDTVAFQSSVRFRNPETGEWSEMESDVEWRFNGQGKVVESRSSASIVSMMSSSSK